MMLTLLLLACADPGESPTDDSAPVVDTDPPDSDLPPDTDPPDPPTCGPGVTVLDGTAGYGDLQAALDAVVEGATLTLCPGEHVGRFALRRGLTLTLQGSTADPADTVITTDDLPGPALDVDVDEVHLTLRAITFRGAVADPLAGALAVRSDPLSASTLTVSSCVFEDNVDAYAGAAMTVVNAAAVVLHDSVFRDNHALYGPAVLLENVRDRVIVEDCAFERNEGNPVAALGVYRSTWATNRLDVDVLRTTFLDNHVHGRGIGTALHVASDNPAPTRVALVDAAFIGNTEEHDTSEVQEGGTVHLAQRTGVASFDVVVDRCTFDDNRHDIANHLALSFPSQTEPSTVVIRDSSFWRGDLVDGVLRDKVEQVPESGAAITWWTMFRDPPALRVTLDTVDFGAGPTENSRQDLVGCETDYEGVVSGSIDVEAGEACLTP